MPEIESGQKIRMSFEDELPCGAFIRCMKSLTSLRSASVLLFVPTCSLFIMN